jgi:hypothetical protein
VTPISTSVYAALAKRQRKIKNPRTQIFVVTLADIKKALKPKPTLSMEQVLVLVPDHYKSEAKAWNPITASQLPLYRPSINHEIYLEKDVNRKPKDVL